MGKLSDLWNQIRDMNDDDPRLPQVQQEINNIEKWMIANGYKPKEEGLTQWGKGNATSELYPHHTGYVRYEDMKLIGKFNGKGINYNADNSIHQCQKCDNT